MAILESSVEDNSGERVRLLYREFIRNANSHRRQIARMYADAIDPWVPYKTGRLAKVYINQDGEIVYSAKNRYGYNYAGIQYEVPYNHPVSGPHPLATDHWDEVAGPIVWSSFVYDVNELLGTKGAKHKPRWRKNK